MNKRIRRSVDSIDSYIAKRTLKYQSEAGSLIVILCHSLFESEAEAASGLVNPLEAMTVSRAKEVIVNLQTAGYVFVQPTALASLPVDSKCAIFSTDDGYYNNVRFMEIAREFSVPLLCFACTYHVLNGRAFWWDILWRERIRRGAKGDDISKETAWLTMRTHPERDNYLVEQFGANCLAPVSDLDRPFRPAELKDFASAPLMNVGAHTRHHENLNLLSKGEAEREVIGSVGDLERMLGVRPEAFSYPHGAWNRITKSVALKAGVRYAFSASPRRNVLPITSPALTLGRFSIVGSEPVNVQCARARSKLRVRSTVSPLIAPFRGLQPWRQWRQSNA